MRRAGAAAVAALLGLAPRAALACAVCTGGTNAASQKGFLIGTALLSLLPLALVGGLVWYLRRRARAIDREEQVRGAAVIRP